MPEGIVTVGIPKHAPHLVRQSFLSNDSKATQAPHDADQPLPVNLDPTNKLDLDVIFLLPLLTLQCSICLFALFTRVGAPMQSQQQ